MPISLIIFSKNRPLQLDLCLDSLHNFNADISPTVIYDCDEDYWHAYETLKLQHVDIAFWKQGNSLFKDVLNRVSSLPCDHVCFLTDDCIVYRETPSLSGNVLNALFNFDLLTCFSLRLGENINRRSVQGQFIKDPLRYSDGLSIFRNNVGMVCYDRTQHFFGGYWNYPLSVDGHIYRRKDVVEWMEELCFIEKIKNWKQTPNELEQALQRFSNIAPPFVAFDQTSSVVNSPNNRVQNTIENHSGEYFDYSCEELLELYLSGKRIRLSRLEFDVNCPHLEIDIMKGLA